MIIDTHVHVSALLPGHGTMSPRLISSLPFRFMRWRLGVTDGVDQHARLEEAVRKMLFGVLDNTPQVDAAAILAFDAVYTEDGKLDDANTHLYVTNDYVIDLARQHPKILLGASVHPYRRDAIAELERVIKAGAVLIKWLPITQGIDPADKRCIPFYECLAHHGVPLLSHTGGEKSLPNIFTHVQSPLLLEEAAKRGVKIIAAHCGTHSAAFEHDHLPDFVYMAKKHEHFYGDTAALNLPFRSYAYRTILADPEVNRKLVHGSDWPIIPIPPLGKMGFHEFLHLMEDANWLARDVRIKQRLGFDEAYWTRAASVLRLPTTPASAGK